MVITVDNEYQNINIESGESSGKKDIRWGLDQTFFFKEKYQNFRNKYFTFKLKKNLKDEDAFAVLKVDLMTIATGPFLYSVRLNHMSKPNTTAGVLSFKVEVEQLQKLTLSLNNMNCWFVSSDERALYVTFRIITYEDSINSEKSKSIVGEIVNSDAYQTKYKWDTLTPDGKDLSLELITSIESLKSSSLQLCIWKDKTFKRFDDIRECRYKNFLSSDTEDYAELTKAKIDAEAIHNQRLRVSETSRALRNMSSLKERDNTKLTPRKRGIERAKSSGRLQEDSLLTPAMHRTLRKKLPKTRGNLENLEGE